jgi:hypothetical protein
MPLRRCCICFDQQVWYSLLLSQYLVESLVIIGMVFARSSWFCVSAHYKTDDEEAVLASTGTSFGTKMPLPGRGGKSCINGQVFGPKPGGMV